MWEPANPRERADFEEDLIASTNENLYQAVPVYARQKGHEMERQTFLETLLHEVENFDREHAHNHLLIDEESAYENLELDLDMDDLLEELVSAEEEQDPLELDIFADRANNSLDQ